MKWMKLANRRALRRIAAGEFPDLQALGPGGSVHHEEGVPQRPAV